MSEFRTKKEVHNRAQKAVGKPMSELFGGQQLNGKSGPGDAFEHWFGKKKDSASEPDMREAGVELKATPFKKLKKTTKSGEPMYSAKERLVLNIINYDELAAENFEHSHFLHKNSVIELGFYEYLKDVPKSQWQFKHTVLYEMEKDVNDFAVIENDWRKIQQYVLDGKAEELNEGMTDYLAPCTKGTNAKTMRSQPFSNVKAKQRAFSLKQGYMTHLYRDFVDGDKKTESIFKGKFDINSGSIEEQVQARLDKWVGTSTKSLEEKLHVKSTAKSVRNLLAARMLGLSSAVKFDDDSVSVEEFEKSNIVPKTVRFDKNGKNKESMSFPPFNFKELATETWNDEDGEPSAEWHKFLIETKLLFLVFQDVDGTEKFIGAKFFRIPDKDIEGDIREVWEDTVMKLNQGVQLIGQEAPKNKRGYAIYNNFIKLTHHKICHVRPHATFADYSIGGKYSNQLPVPARWCNQPTNHKLFADDWMATQSFWLNNDYIKEQVKELLR